MKEKWFDFVMNNAYYWTHGMTFRRLERVKEFVFEDKATMDDLLIRHRGHELTPQQMKEMDLELFRHCIGNFVCNIHYIMMDHKIIKG